MKMKKEKSQYKFLRPEQVTDLRGKTSEDLLKEFLSQLKHVQAIKKMRKEDGTLKDLKKLIKEHRENSQELKDAKEEVKRVREEIDSEIEEELEDKKALEGGYRDQMKEHQEMMHAIQQIVDRRNNP